MARGLFQLSTLFRPWDRHAYWCVICCILWSCLCPASALPQPAVNPPQIRLVATFDHPQSTDLSWSADGQYLATSGLSGILKKGLFEKNINLPTIAVWDVANKKLLQSYPRKGARPFVALIGQGPQILGFSPTASGWDTGIAFSIWDAGAGEAPKHIAGPASADNPRAYVDNQPRSFAYNFLTGRVIVAHGQGNAVFLYNVSDWSRKAIVLQGLRPHNLSFSPDGRHLAFGDQSRHEIIELSSGKQIVSFYPFDTVSNSTAWSPDGRRIAFIKSFIGGIKASAPSDIKVWDAVTGRSLHDYMGDFSGSALVSNGRAITWSFDGRFIATSTFDRIVRLWHADRPELAAEVSREKSSGSGIAFSPTANLLAIASHEAVKIFEIK